MGGINLKGFRPLRLTAALLALLLALWGCGDISVLKNLKAAEGNNSGGGGGGGGGGNPTTIKWQTDSSGSYIQFYTNDTANYGYTFYVAYVSENQVPMTTDVIGSAYKVTGALGEPYGFVFNYQDSNNFYEVLIEADQYYTAYKVVGGTFTALLPPPYWYTSSSLTAGLNKVNTVRIAKSGSTYTVYFNGVSVFSFTDTTFSGGEAGFKINIGSTDENFSTSPEDVRFKLTSPVANP